MPGDQSACRSTTPMPKKMARFDAVFREALPASARELVVYALARSGSEPPRLGVSVGRKVGNAVVRNTVKRRLRAAFRELASGLGPIEVIAVARPPICGLHFAALKDRLFSLVQQSLLRAGKRSGASRG